MARAFELTSNQSEQVKDLQNLDVLVKEAVSFHLMKAKLDGKRLEAESWIDHETDLLLFAGAPAAIDDPNDLDSHIEILEAIDFYNNNIKMFNVAIDKSLNNEMSPTLYLTYALSGFVTVTADMIKASNCYFLYQPLSGGVFVSEVKLNGCQSIN